MISVYDDLVLIVEYIKNNPVSSRRMRKESIISFSFGFYIGEVKDNKPEGRGTFYFDQRWKRTKDVFAKGKWKNGVIDEVSIF